MFKSKSYKRSLGCFAIVALWGLIYLCYRWLGKEVSTNIQLAFAGYMLFIHVVLFRSATFKARYFAALKSQKHMTPLNRKLLYVMMVSPTIVGLVIAGWWVCLVSTLVWVAFLEYDFRILMSDHSVNTAA